MYSSSSYTINIILADDDEDDCIFFKDALAELPVPVKLTTVNDGVQLMELLYKKEVLPDVLYLDLNMPCKNGFDCLTEIKQDEILKELPVVILSTSFDKEILSLLHNGGAHYYIQKPPTFSSLKKVIHKSLVLIAETNNQQPKKERFILSI